MEAACIGLLGFFESGSLGWVRGAPEPDFVEAQLYELPDAPHLREAKKVISPQSKAEMALSRSAHSSAASLNADQKLTEENQTEQGPVIPRDHGPIPVFRPRPVLPSYLEYQDVPQSVVVVFEVLADATVMPRLMVSSGNSEIDAVILETLKKWRFEPEVREGKPVNSRFRARVEIIPS
jgi:protein TonB